MSDLIKREDAIRALLELSMINCINKYDAVGKCVATIIGLPSANRPQGWVDKAISIIDDMQREGIIDYEQAWEFRMRARMKGAEDEH